MFSILERKCVLGLLKKAARVVQTLAASDHFFNIMNLSLIRLSSRIVLPASRQSVLEVLRYFNDAINGKQ